MSILVQCPECGTRLQAGRRRRGNRFAAPNAGTPSPSSAIRPGRNQRLQASRAAAATGGRWYPYFFLGVATGGVVVAGAVVLLLVLDPFGPPSPPGLLKGPDLKLPAGLDLNPLIKGKLEPNDPKQKPAPT